MEVDANGVVSAISVAGCDVYDMQGRRSGTVVDLLLDDASGEAIYVLVDFGPLLGDDREKVGCCHPVPWSAFMYDGEREAYVLAVDAEALRWAPKLSAEDVARASDDLAWRQEVHDYYNIRPYWVRESTLVMETGLAAAPLDRIA